MAQRGRPIPAALITLLRRLRKALSIRATARESGIARNTVRKYARLAV